MVMQPPPIEAMVSLAVLFQKPLERRLRLGGRPREVEDALLNSRRECRRRGHTGQEKGNAATLIRRSVYMYWGLTRAPLGGMIASLPESATSTEWEGKGGSRCYDAVW